jgi:hypothetical protein
LTATVLVGLSIGMILLTNAKHAMDDALRNLANALEKEQLLRSILSTAEQDLGRLIADKSRSDSESNEKQRDILALKHTLATIEQERNRLSGEAIARLGWNDEVRDLIERVLLNGVQKPVGRQLYSEIDTALAAGRNGDWKVGAGLTRDNQPYVIRVRGKRLEKEPLTGAEALQNKPGERSVQSSLDNSFPHRSQTLVMLTRPELHLATNEAGVLRLRGRVYCTPTAPSNVEHVSIMVTRRTRLSGQVGTQGAYQAIPWKRLQSGFLTIDVAVSDPPPTVGEELEISLNAFVLEPRPSFYRISNQPTCAIMAPVASEK